ncbi:hypothetical protein FDP41_006306 [Naegleria fowleri]|uniref:GMP phosphodiesterase delta subunit domain-containing protein n=1 Tax=Naegleria fowleri TaxID=5763 RepID=A0A6A5BIZ9_NAEFO|nr:uncharacterized protein FDP41_006306 [Naegleria fowleri]KAF0974832.1 hypothetical protein FDP41_006306 [Naegleria fowleri]CAG4707963.1 unnamed protein product [Naegleria fowleri]
MLANEKKCTPQDVLKFTKPTEGFLCPLNANTVGIQFLEFKIRNCDTGEVLFHTSAEETAKELMKQGSNLDEDSLRSINYKFDKSMLRSKGIGTTLVFKVGPKPVKNFRMIERHYFKDRLLKGFDFNFKFCIPNSQNTWECIYSMPELTEEEIKEIENSPYQVKSDSFYFVNDDEMIMHNKAAYAYVDTKKN